MAQFHWEPESYLELMREEVPQYERLQDEVVAATAGSEARRVLELGTGTGETARRVLAAHPAAELLGVDESPGMLEAARSSLDAARVRLVEGRLQDPLPDGPWDLVVSCLAVHHLDGEGKADLFRRIAAVLAPGGRFVLGDVIVPENPDDRVTPIDETEGYDLPDRIDDQLRWLAAAGLEPELRWVDRDLAVIVATSRRNTRGHTDRV
jgi:tRNA (cmo5U34)-methyltransferase